MERSLPTNIRDPPSLINVNEIRAGWVAFVLSFTCFSIAVVSYNVVPFADTTTLDTTRTNSSQILRLLETGLSKPSQHLIRLTEFREDTILLEPRLQVFLLFLDSRLRSFAQEHVFDRIHKQSQVYHIFLLIDFSDLNWLSVFMDLHGPYETEYKNNFLFFTSTGRGRDPWHRLNEQTYDGVRLPGARMYWPQIQNTSLEMDFQNDGDDFYRQSSGDYGSGKPRPMHRRDGDRFANAKHIHGGHLNGLHLRRLE